MTNDDGLLQVSGVHFGYPGRPDFLGPVQLTLAAGLVAVVGPNGAGKSTLLRLMAGLLVPRSGSIAVRGQRVHRMNSRNRAKKIAFMPQHTQAPPDLVAREVVLLGRYPHRSYALFDTSEDLRIAEKALLTTRASQFADRTLDTLSSGEQQRIHLAAAIAQKTELLILDEPTSALDPYHQLSIFGVLRALCSHRGVTVVVATHDLNLAGQFADAILLLRDGKPLSYGAPKEVLQPETLEAAYGVRFHEFPSEDVSRPWVLPTGQVDAVVS